MAQFKFTVLLMPNGPHKITGLPFDESLVKSDKSVEDGEIVKLLKTSANPKAARKKKKAAEKAVTEVSAWYELSGGQTGVCLGYRIGTKPGGELI